MEKIYVVVRQKIIGAELCYNLKGELIMNSRSASTLQKGLSNAFPRDTYKIFKEVKDAKKGNSSI